jgi:hypothetical protein
LQALLCLCDTLSLNHLVRPSTNDWICLSLSDWDLELNCEIIFDFSFRDWCVLLRVLLNPIEDLPSTSSIELRMLSSVSGLVHPVHEDSLDTRS